MFRPPLRFVLDSEERWWPVDLHELTLVGARVIPPGGRSSYVLDSLDALPSSGGTIDMPAGMRQPKDAKVVVYVRVKPGVPYVCVQTWLFYLYNPKTYVTTGAHEGDWEMVQVLYSRFDTRFKDPLLVTASRHKHGAKREFQRCRVVDGKATIFVALGSHANYFAPEHDFEDKADGEGRVIDDYEVEPLGAWASWPGHVGNSTGTGDSPLMPLRQLERANSPIGWHLKAKDA